MNKHFNVTKVDHIAFGDYMNHARGIVLYVIQQLQNVNTNKKVARTNVFTHNFKKIGLFFYNMSRSGEIITLPSISYIR